jgi:hypothetical protein
MEKACPAILECEECMWWREFRHKNDKGQVDYFHRCSIEIIIEYILRAEDSLDGLQTAVNEGNNDRVTMMRGFARHGVTQPLEMWQNHRESRELKMLEDSDGLAETE